MSWIDQRPDDAMDGAFTAVGPEIVRTVEPGIFREAMSRLGAAVHVITTAGPGGPARARPTAVGSGSDRETTLF
jgi:flavin reductase